MGLEDKVRDRLMDFLGDRGYSMSQLSRSIGLSYITLNGFLMGTLKTHLKTILRIKKYLDEQVEHNKEDDNEVA